MRGFISVEDATIALARLICNLVEHFEEVNFSSRSDGSLYHKICLAKKQTGSKKQLHRYDQRWKNNCQNIQDLVKQYLTEKQKYVAKQISKNKTDSSELDTHITCTPIAYGEMPTEVTKYLSPSTKKANPNENTCSNELFAELKTSTSPIGACTKSQSPIILQDNIKKTERDNFLLNGDKNKLENPCEPAIQGHGISVPESTMSRIVEVDNDCERFVEETAETLNAEVVMERRPKFGLHLSADKATRTLSTDLTPVTSRSGKSYKPRYLYKDDYGTEILSDGEDSIFENLGDDWNINKDDYGYKPESTSGSSEKLSHNCKEGDKLEGSDTNDTIFDTTRNRSTSIDRIGSRGSTGSSNDSTLSTGCDKYIEPPKSSTAKKVFTFMEGQFSIASLKLKEQDVIDGDKLRSELEKLMLNKVKYACPLRFYSFRRNQTNSVIYAQCRYVSHKQKFRFDVTDSETAMSNVYITSTTPCKKIIHDGNPIFRTLKGKEREEVKKALIHTPPRLYQLEVNKQIDQEIAADGHYQNARRLTTFQKAKSEVNCKNDVALRSGDLSDLFQKHILDRAVNDPYIRSTGIPLHVHLYSEEQLNIIEPKVDRVLHFDATGSIIRKPNGIQCKRIMYYAMIINKNGSLIPLAEMITAEHDVTSICVFLKRYRTFVHIKNVAWPPFSVVVVDWSWALIHSVMDEWNKMTTLEYLKEVYVCVTSGIDFRHNLIVVHSCCAHFQKRVSTKIQQKFPQHVQLKTFILECMGLLIHCNDILKLDSVFKEFVTVLLSKDAITPNISIARLYTLHSAMPNIDNIEDVPESDEEVAFDAALKNKHGEKIFTDSPFFSRYYNLLHDIKTQVSNYDEVVNKYYAPEIAEYITKQYMPFAPMWSALLLKKVTPSINRLSNANIECYFNIVKKHVLNNEVNLKIGRFIDKIKTYKSQLCAEIPLKAALKTRSRRKVHRTKENSSTHLVEEMWKRKKKSQFSHFEGRSLGRIAKKMKMVTSTPISSQKIRSSKPAITPDNITLLNLNENSNHANAMENGLFDDIEYYMQDTGCLYTIGQYSVVECDPIMGFDIHHLFSDTYHTLKDDRWIDGDVIDAFAIGNLQCNWKNILYVPTAYTSYLIGDFHEHPKVPTFRMFQISKVLAGKLLLPYLRSGHWCLLAVDIDNKTLTHMDPRYHRGPNESRAIGAFKEYLRECSTINKNNLCDINWTITACARNRPLQSAADNNNCGIYVMYYMECIAKNIPFIKDFEPSDYRKYVAGNLLSISDTMSEACLHCFATRNVTLLVMCNTCRRWTHQSCLARVFNDTTDYKDSASRYRCVLCKMGYRKWMRYVRKS